MKSYLINLSQSTKRLEHSIQEFKAQDWDFERYEAVNGTNLLIKRLKTALEFTGSALITNTQAIKNKKNLQDYLQS